MKTKIFLILLIIHIIFMGCDRIIAEINCSDCYPDESMTDSTDLEIKFSLGSEFDSVYFVLFKGKIEDKDTIFEGISHSDSEFFYVASKKEYSVKAVYKSEKRSVQAVDGTRIRIDFITDYCNESCYTVSNNTLDVRIRDYQ